MRRHVALCWELGGGYGHLASLLEFAVALNNRGFHVHLIVRDICAAAKLFSECPVTLHQAPFQHGCVNQFPITPTYSHILHNIGFGDSESLLALTRGWRSLFQAIEPCFIVTEHAPTALLAAKSLLIPAIACGSGFMVPPIDATMPVLMRAKGELPDVRVERIILDNSNRVLKTFDTPDLHHMSELYSRGVERILMTVPELDHFPHRKGEQYFGCWPFRCGERSTSQLESFHIIAYLKPQPWLSTVLRILARSRIPTWVMGSNIPLDLRARHECDTLCFSSGMVDLAAINGAKCIGITNGNFGTALALLLKGTPVISIPIFLEQLILSRLIERMGAGLIVRPESVATLDAALQMIVDDTRYRRNAQLFATKYEHFSEASFRESLHAGFESTAAFHAPPVSRP